MPRNFVHGAFQYGKNSTINTSPEKNASDDQPTGGLDSTAGCRARDE
jgi:hypothetical protein